MPRILDTIRHLACVGLLVAVVGLPDWPVRADDKVASPKQSGNDGQAAVSLLRRYCVECHGADTHEAGIRLDGPILAVDDHLGGETLEKLLSVLSQRSMPPEDAARPTDSQRKIMVSWLQDRLTHLVAQAKSKRRTRNRRLTVDEYNFTMRALFGVDAEFGDLLPPDAESESGYRTDPERLSLSAQQIETYLDSARRAVMRYIQFGELDRQSLYYHIEFEDLFYATADRYGTRKRAPASIDVQDLTNRRAVNRASTPQYVDPLSPKLPGAFSDDEKFRAAIPKLNQQYVAIPRRLTMGELIVRVRAAATANRRGRFPRMRVEAGITLGDGCSMNKQLLGEVDVTASLGDPRSYEFRIRLEDVPTKGAISEEESFDRLSVFDMDQIFISNVSCDQKAVFALGRGGYSDPDTGSERIAGDLQQMAEDGVNFLHLDCLEIEMLPGVAADNRPYRWRVQTGRTDNESGVARDFLQRFMPAAFRRPVADDEITLKLELFTSLRGRGFTFEESLRETAAAVLVSPSFLFLESNSATPAEDPTPHQLAARLSYLLWLAPPDDQLIKRAQDGGLMDESVLREEAQRLLDDPRSRRFLSSFCRQWLRLDRHANISVNRQQYPTYDDDFASISVQETLAYFLEVFASDATALDLIDSDYAMLNDRLADHYDIENVNAGRLHKVNLPANSVRGGLLTQASLLTMNSNGVDSHPIRRGVWLLDRILNTPAPPPPENVPELDENDPVLRNLSLKERIERHRQPGACRNCHEKIDPWGIPFENFDAVGRWRDKVEVAGADRSEWRAVDPAAVLPSGRSINGITELKRYLRRQHAHLIANAMAHHMLTYAIGRPPDYADRPQVQAIEQHFAASQFRIRELVLTIVVSELFCR